MKRLSVLLLSLLLTSCASKTRMKTVSSVDIKRFMGDWYVLAGRFTPFEVDVHNGLESYTWNEKEQRIDIGFTYNKGSLTGERKSIPQKGWIYNTETNAHWKVSPFWPLKFNYLIVALDEDYGWTAIGVPDQKYLWIMARDWKNQESVVKKAIEQLDKIGYNTKDLVIVPHSW